MDVNKFKEYSKRFRGRTLRPAQEKNMTLDAHKQAMHQEPIFLHPHPPSAPRVDANALMPCGLKPHNMELVSRPQAASGQRRPKPELTPLLTKLPPGTPEALRSSSLMVTQIQGMKTLLPQRAVSTVGTCSQIGPKRVKVRSEGKLPNDDDWSTDIDHQECSTSHTHAKAIQDQKQDLVQELQQSDGSVVVQALHGAEEFEFGHKSYNGLHHVGKSNFVGSLDHVDAMTPLKPLTGLATSAFSEPTLACRIPASRPAAKAQKTKKTRLVSRPQASHNQELPSLATTVIEQQSHEALANKKKVKRPKEKMSMISRGEGQTRGTGLDLEHSTMPSLHPLPAPGQALMQAFKMLKNPDWEKKVEALTTIRCLALHHSQLLLPRLHHLTLAVIQEVKSIRSVLACAAILTLAHLFAHLGQNMDGQVEISAQALLQKAGDVSGFIRDDVDLALNQMVLNVSPMRSLNALINLGARHRNPVVRKSAALHLKSLAELMGPSCLLSGKKDVTDRFIPVISSLALDSSQPVRAHAHNILTILASHPNFNAMVEMFAPNRDQNAIKDVIKKGQRRNQQ